MQKYAALDRAIRDHILGRTEWARQAEGLLRPFGVSVTMVEYEGYVYGVQVFTLHFTAAYRTGVVQGLLYVDDVDLIDGSKVARDVMRAAYEAWMKPAEDPSPDWRHTEMLPEDFYA